MMQTSLAKRLRVLRAERGLTLRQVEERAGIRAATLMAIEHGRAQPRDVTLGKLAKAYDVPVEELLEEPLLTGPKVDAPDPGQLGELEELTHAAKALKAEWTRLAAYDRVVGLSRNEHLRTLERLEEIENRLREVKDRVDKLQPPLCLITYYNPDKPPRVEFYDRPTPEEEADLKEKLGDYEEVGSVFELTPA